MSVGNLRLKVFLKIIINYSKKIIMNYKTILRYLIK